MKLYVICFLLSLSWYKTPFTKRPGLNIDYISKETCPDIYDFDESTLIDSIKYIPLETTDSCLLGKLVDVQVYDHKIFVLDRYEKLSVFGEDGHYITSISKKGRAPTEYLTLTDFFIDKENQLLGLVDGGKSQILYFDFAGNYVKKKNVDREFANLLTHSAEINGHIFNYYMSSYLVIYSAKIYSEDSGLRSAIHPYPMNRCTTTEWTKHPLALTSGGITFVKPLSDTLFHFDGDSIVPRYIVETDLKLASQRQCDLFNPEKSKKLNYFDFLRYLQSQKCYLGIENVYETKDYLILDESDNISFPTKLIWNKKQKKGFRIKTKTLDGKHAQKFCLSYLISSTDDYLVSAYSTENMFVSFKIARDNGCKLDRALVKIMDEWDEENNPVIALCYMKKKI